MVGPKRNTFLKIRTKNGKNKIYGPKWKWFENVRTKIWGSCNQMLWHVGVSRIREKICLIFSSLSYPYINIFFNVFNIGVVFTNQFYVHSKFIFLPNSLLLLYCLQRWYVYMQCTLRKVSHVIRNSRLHSNYSDMNT